MTSTRILVPLAVLATLLSFGCSSNPAQPKPAAPSLAANDTPANATSRLIGAYEQKKAPEYQGMFTGDFTYEFSTSTDPTLVQQYSTGWFKNDEKESSSHLFNGYTPPGGATLPAATSINIKLATATPVDDNSAGVDPATHKILATRVDGDITVPQAGTEPLTYVLTNNYNVFYFVRGDVAAGLDSTQAADAQHWYVYKWVDQTQSYIPRPSGRGALVKTQTWGAMKATYR
jgi:hypothetical protein